MYVQYQQLLQLFSKHQGFFKNNAYIQPKSVKTPFVSLNSLSKIPSVKTNDDKTSAVNLLQT